MASLGLFKATPNTHVHSRHLRLYPFPPSSSLLPTQSFSLTVMVSTTPSLTEYFSKTPLSGASLSK
jgi:hypothetical protein